MESNAHLKEPLRRVTGWGVGIASWAGPAMALACCCMKLVKLIIKFRESLRRTLVWGRPNR